MKLIEDKVTDTHIYFWGDPSLSNFGPTLFEYKGHRFFNSEQAYMWEKALYFNDFDIADQILETKNPRDAKNLGRKVSNYVDEDWSKVRYQLMVDVCLAKYRQDQDKRETLLSTGNRTIVEASPHDKIWGVGWHWTDPEILDESNWKGENLLGKALMEVREVLKTDEEK